MIVFLFIMLIKNMNINSNEDEYDVEVTRAAEDVKNLVTLWVEAGLVNK